MDQKQDFLQSEDWLRFQEVAGYEVVRMTDDGFTVAGIVYSLPIAGKYLYTPRFPWSEIPNTKYQIQRLLDSARSHGCGWIRIEPGDTTMRDEALRFVRENGAKATRAPHDMQPKETFVVDIGKSEEELLAGMKPKVRYNVRLAEKKGVRVFRTTDEKYRKIFVDLVTRTADRKGIMPHPRSYYETMLATLLGDTATLFVAEHEGDILGINLVIFFGDTAIYLHGGSADVKREYMAPFLLQWEAIREARRLGCVRYDFGGVRMGQESRNSGSDSWAGITRFKVGFSPTTAPTVFPGCYDIVLSPTRYFLYRFFSAVRSCVSSIRKSAGV